MFLASASHWPYNKMVIKRSAKHLPHGPGWDGKCSRTISFRDSKSGNIPNVPPHLEVVWFLHVFTHPIILSTTHGIIFPHGLVYIDIIDPKKRILTNSKIR